MFVVGTAGHVDHGKSTLVQALTGINPDRLREEQERQMTIDLGFAWLTLPSGREVSMIDVPGHEDFIKNMLAGVGGIDVALLVVAADESVMPQTREHLAILDLLRVSHGVVALTKCDLVHDAEWMELVQEEVREALRGTALSRAAIIPVSAVTGEGLPQLLAEIDRILDQVQPRQDTGQPRLPIDRVFTIAGFGTVVTGTLSGGRLSVGEEAVVLPESLRVRIRGLQTHKTKVQEALPGARVAANLVGVTTEDLRRGQVLTIPGWLEPTTLLDARLHVVPDAPGPIRHNMVVDFYTGSAHAEAHVRLLDAEVLQPGQTGWVQLRLSEPVAVVRGDRFILRLASPSITVGGGEIVQPHPEHRHRRFRREVLENLEALSQGAPEDVLLQMLGPGQVVEAREIIQRSHLPVDQAVVAIEALARKGLLVVLAEALPGPSVLPQSSVGLLARATWSALLERVTQALSTFHTQHPLRAGMPREEVKSRLGLGAQAFNPFIEHAARAGQIAATPTSLSLPQRRVALSPDQQRAVDALLRRFRASPMAPPSYAEAEEALGSELLQFVIEQGTLIKVSDSVLFDADTYQDMQRRVVSHLSEHQSITVAEVRDLLGTSRKYALGLLEDLDRRHITKRLGDARILR